MPVSGLSFLQSVEWQEIQERMGRATLRIGSVLAIRHALPLGFHYWYVPRPALEERSLREILRRGDSSGALFIKIDPAGLPPDIGVPVFPARSLQPATTIYINCRAPDDELMAGMHPKTRYNIRLSERHGVIVRAVQYATVGKDLQVFLRLLSDTARRDGFHPHPAAHYKAILGEGSGDFSNVLFLAERGGNPIAGAIVNFYRPSGIATYLHGGSSYDERSRMAPYMLHWGIIRVCREKGLASYDLGGIDKLRWPGLTRFKEGFGGIIHRFPQSLDYALRPCPYAVYRLQDRLRHRIS